MRRELALALALALAGAGCQQKMATQARLRAYEESPVFPDGSSARMPVEGTVARGTLIDDAAVATGRRDGQPVQEIPVPVTRALLERGRQRYDIYCAPCHSRSGDGQGIIVQRGFTAPPSYHVDRLREAPAGHFFEVITRGYGAMFSYADRVPVADRWAIVSYIRALQKSQHARASELPPKLRQQLEDQP
jgi:mono/diheme cytochrome c family protein